MKKIICFLLFVLPIFCHAQDKVLTNYRTDTLYGKITDVNTAHLVLLKPDGKELKIPYYQLSYIFMKEYGALTYRQCQDIFAKRHVDVAGKATERENYLFEAGKSYNRVISNSIGVLVFYSIKWWLNIYIGRNALSLSPSELKALYVAIIASEIAGTICQIASIAHTARIGNLLKKAGKQVQLQNTPDSIK